MTATCTSCGRTYVAGQPCPARGDGAHTRRRPALPAKERKRVAIEVKFSDDEVRALGRLAKRWRVTRTEAVRRAVAGIDATLELRAGSLARESCAPHCVREQGGSRCSCGGERLRAAIEGMDWLDRRGA